MTYKLDKLSVLIVEDMLPMLTLTKSLLHIFGFRKIYTARDGVEGYNLYFNKQPDLIITDWHMDSMDGLDLIHKIRTDEDSPTPYIPIILMTGYSNQKRVEKARDNGMTEFLMKPYTAKDLCNKSVQLIEKPRTFVKCNGFIGPDRRRRVDAYDGPIRRTEDYYEAQDKELKKAAEDIISKNKNKQ